MEEKNNREGTITIKKDTLWKYSTFILGALVIVLVFVAFSGDKGGITGNVVNTGEGQQAIAPPPAQKAEINIGDAPVIGDKNAKVTVVKFSDFSCPFCAAASGDNEQLISYMKQRNPSWEPIVTNMMKDYVETGKVRFAVKYMMGHSGGKPAQLVAWCLNDQSADLYWKFYSQAFVQQDNVEDLAKMTTLAKTIGGDMAKLQKCLDSKKYDSRFDREQNEGRQAGAQGTPAFFVNGQLISGAVPYSQMKQAIDSALAA